MCNIDFSLIIIIRWFCSNRSFHYHQKYFQTLNCQLRDMLETIVQASPLFIIFTVRAGICFPEHKVTGTYV